MIKVVWKPHPNIFELIVEWEEGSTKVKLQLIENEPQKNVYEKEKEQIYLQSSCQGQ